MKYEVQTIINEKTLEEWTEIFAGVEACVTPVLTYDEVINNPQVIARNMIQTLFDDEKYIGNPIKLSETPGKIQTKAPELGEHTKQILQEVSKLP
ncbi:CoA transferase [Oceanobacillus salinisoli]|uniref:CoA transferase n=1 Tax=Oceanobacillus salinisoli TaxID=2678611 RepID=UPI0022AFEE51|nr:CoA transferase [Oceanobacillus salinisoli]